MSGRNPQKLMKLRTGQVLPKPRVRRKSKSGRQFPWPVEERKRRERTRWYGTVAELFSKRRAAPRGLSDPDKSGASGTPGRGAARNGGAAE